MKVRSATEPQAIQFTANSVFIASNITPYEEVVDGHTLTGYQKDAYLVSQMERIASLEQELSAAKILLGVD